MWNARAESVRINQRKLAAINRRNKNKREKAWTDKSQKSRTIVVDRKTRSPDIVAEHKDPTEFQDDTSVLVDETVVLDADDVDMTFVQPDNEADLPAKSRSSIPDQSIKPALNPTESDEDEL
jgi:hypothetical protein